VGVFFSGHQFVPTPLEIKDAVLHRNLPVRSAGHAGHGQGQSTGDSRRVHGLMSTPGAENTVTVDSEPSGRSGATPISPSRACRVASNVVVDPEQRRLATRPVFPVHRAHRPHPNAAAAAPPPP